MMKWVCALALLGWIGTVAAEEYPEGRDLRCRVVDESGLPVSGLKVHLYGLERDALGYLPDEDEPGQIAGWQFTTDDDGQFTARFGKFRPSQLEDRTQYTGPGYGRFLFVVTKAGWAGAVSRQIMNLDTEGLAQFQSEASWQRPPSWDRDEWQRGEFEPLVLNDQPSVGPPLAIVLKRGLELHGHIVDTSGRPAGDGTVGVSLDVHVGSHTGYGGEIFSQVAKVDKAGRFILRHVYPNVFKIGVFDGDGAPYWIKTRLREQWFDQIVDRITPRLGDPGDASDYEKRIDLEVVAAWHPPYRYFGRVTGPDGHGLAGIKVIVRSVEHEHARTWGESHGSGQPTHTDRNGNYSLRVGSRFVDGIWVREGKYTGGLNTDEEDLLAPGRHDFSVQPKAAGQ